jgi:fructose-bisphosphate aldolase class II
MSITNTKKMLAKAYENNYAILHINVINYDMARVSMLAAQEKNSPIIIAVSEKALKNFAGPKDFVEMVTNIDDHFKIKVPVAIHLDHGAYETAIECINAGFTSVMFDGSKSPLDQNIKHTKEIIRLAKLHSVTVEAEVGAVTGKIEDKGEKGELASVEECKKMADLGIDCLAAGIGNIHGEYPAG